MTDEIEWSEWIEHDGKGCPLPIGTLCHRVFDKVPDGFQVNEDISRIEAHEFSSWDGAHTPDRFGWDYAKVIRYRYRISKAMRGLKRIAENPAPVRETEDA